MRTRVPQPPDTAQQKAILRQSGAARRCRQRFPAGTSITTGKMSGVVKRHVPTGNSQGGYLIVIWDTGVTGRISPIAVRPC